MSDSLNYIGKFLIVTGILISLVGVLLLIFRNSGIPFLGRLPGDIIIDRPNMKIYVPITSMIIISLVLSLLLLASFPLTAKFIVAGIRRYFNKASS